MTIDDFPEDAPARPIWLITLADLALLLVGFFVFLQASQTLDRKALSQGIREGFGAPVDTAAPAVPAGPAAMPVAAASMTGFATGSALLAGSPDGVIEWARDAARDPRVTLTIAGNTDGSSADVDPDTGSATVLAADRARAVAVALAHAGAIVPDRMIITTMTTGMTTGATTGGTRRVLVTSGFTGTAPGRRR